MSWRPYYILCHDAEVVQPPPPEAQITPAGYGAFNRQIACNFVLRRPNADDVVPREFLGRERWSQGWYTNSSDRMARLVHDWYYCALHPNAERRVFRQDAAWSRHSRLIIDNGYRSAIFGTEIPWPDHVGEAARRGVRLAYFPARPRARSTASLWN